MKAQRLRVGFIGAGSIVGTHLAALDSLGRVDVVAICSRTAQHAEVAAGARPLAVYTDADLMLRRERLDGVFICVPPYVAPHLCRLATERGVAFMVEKPVAALDPTVADEVADEVEDRGLVAAVAYQLRGLDFLPEVRTQLRSHPPELVTARWLGSTPKSSWWGRTERSGGQVIEQMTHLYDLARTLLGDASVVAATSTAATEGDESIDVAGSVTAIVRFNSGALGAFTNSRQAVDPVIELELISAGLQAAISLDVAESEWSLTLADAETKRQIAVKRSPYVVQAEAFLDAVEAGDPRRVLATYREGLATYLLTRHVYDYANQEC